MKLMDNLVSTQENESCDRFSSISQTTMQHLLTYFLFQCIFLQSPFIFLCFLLHDWYDFYVSDILYVHSIKVKKLPYQVMA